MQERLPAELVAHAARQPVHLTIIVPVLNEEGTVRHAINRLRHVDYPCPVEFVVIDDGSTDATWQELTRFSDPRLVLLRHASNRGKGGAVLTGLEVAKGTHVLVFDADLEYDPADIGRLLRPVLEGRAATVYGTRLFGRDTVYQSFWLAFGNRAMTLSTNVLYDAAISDLHTCLKLIPTQLLKAMQLDERGFGLDTQMTARLLLSGVRPYEVPVSYNSRTTEEGKKIGWRHGVESLRLLLKERCAQRKHSTWLKNSREVARLCRSAAAMRMIFEEAKSFQWDAPLLQSMLVEQRTHHDVVDLTDTVAAGRMDVAEVRSA